jgi:hypothetical protein
VIPVTWPGTLGTQGGNGDFHSWNRLTLTVEGTNLTGRSSPCGSTLPPLMLTVLVGGGMSLVEIPTTIWDTPSVPDFPSSGTLSGWSSGSTLKTNPGITLLGSSMADPAAAWPKASTDVTPVDTDGDQNPGIASIPRMGGGYNPPPVSIVGPRTQRIDITSRTSLALDGAFDSCTELSGAARLERLDSHVLGCKRDDGQPCTAAQTDFLDDNRTVYSTQPGKFTAKIVDAGTTCAAIRQALPM